MKFIWLGSLCAALSVLSACSTVSSGATSQIVRTDERGAAYFSASGEYGREPIKNGYERRFLGTTKDGSWVAQDFYGINGNKQTEPFVLFDERGAYDWDSMPFTDGAITLYFADGKKMSHTRMARGKPVGVRERFYRNGKVFQRQQFDDDGQMTLEQYFTDDGKRLLTIDYSARDGWGHAAMQLYDAKGAAYAPSPQTADVLRSTLLGIQSTSDQLQAEEARLAGQTPPVADGVADDAH